MDYKFKLGDKGKTVGGIPYEVVGIFTDVVYGLLTLQDRPEGRHLRTCLHSGSFYEVGDSTYDLLPPKRSIWINVYECGGSPSRLRAIEFSSKETAQSWAPVSPFTKVLKRAVEIEVD